MNPKIMRKPLQWLLFIALWATGGAYAAQIDSLQWDANGSATVHIATKGSPSYDVQSLEGGQRLRLRFPSTTLGVDVKQLGARGDVKGVYPYLGDNGATAYVDFLTVNPAQLRVRDTSGGLQVSIASNQPAPAAAPAPSVPSGDNALEGMSYVKLPGDRIQIRLKMAKAPPAPNSFSVSNPASVSFDFPATRIRSATTSLPITAGMVTRVTAVEDDKRTRVVLSLVHTVPYTTSVDGDYFNIVVDNPEGLANTERARVTQFAAASRPGRHSLKNIDFRRGKAGDGKVIVDLSDSDVGINIREQGGELLVDFIDATVPQALQRRLDVVDFATPVQTIETYARGKDVRMVIKPNGQYEQMAYQAGRVFTMDVKPVVKKPGEDAAQKEFTGQKLSLNFQNIDVRSALQVIADFTGLNFVTSDSVKGNLTLRLKDVPWDQALDLILKARNLGMRRKDNVVWVAPADEIAAQEKAQLEAAKANQELEPLVSELIQINYAKAEDIAKLLKSIKAVSTGAQSNPLFGSVSVQKLTTNSNTLLSPRGQVTVDPRTNSLLIQDTSEKIREVRKLIAKLDRPVRQVMIETRLVEATDAFTRNLGIKWGIVRKNDRYGSHGNQVTMCGTLNCNYDIVNGNPVQIAGNALSVNLGASNIGTSTVGSIAATIGKLADARLLNLELSALEVEGKGKIISSPRIITANQKKAHIEQGQERVFTTSVLGVGSVVTKKAVLALDVTPQITPDDRISLDVVVTKDSFADAQQGLLNKKEIQTQVLLNNGETVVIGGIYERATNATTSKIPFLGDLPVIGWAFKKKERFDNRDELLIFLTPRILSDKMSSM